MRRLMYRFYDHIYESDIAHYFPQDEEEFHEIRVKNTKFFIQICGGPKVYEDEAGGLDLNEYMIRVHDDFSITEKSRVEWLGVMRDTMKEMIPDVDMKLQEQFWDYLDNFSKLTVNTFSDGSTYYASLLDKSDTRPID
jgi:hemoglobin